MISSQDIRHGLCCALLAALCGPSLVPADAAAAPASHTVNVDCAKGQSIQDALKRDADELRINVSGFCRENVIVRRSNVHLAGADPDLDGIEGFREGPESPLSAINGALTIDGAQNVQVENLGIRGNSRTGVIIRNSFAEILLHGLKITGYGVYGVFTNDADVQVRDSEVTGDLATALRVDEGGGRLICRHCSIDVTSPDNDGIIGLVEESGSLEINDSDLAGSGLAAFDGSDLLIQGSSVSATAASGLWVANSSALTVADTEYDTGLLAEGKSRILLRGATQTDPAVNRVAGDSYLSDEGTSLPFFPDAPNSIQGELRLDRFSRASITQPDTVIDGDLLCTGGSDASCADPASNVTGGVSGCSLCTP